MAGFVLRRTTPSPQLYVAPPGSLFSYTRDKSKARVYPTRDQATELGLFGATPGCEGKVTAQRRGGVKCDTCGGWFCF